MAINLPGLNYDGKLNIDDLAFGADETEKAILDRTSIVFGRRSLVEPKYGIIDVINPSNIVSEETTRSLLVYRSIINPLNINITPGAAVTLNGSIVLNTTLIEDFQLARIAANDINVVYIENELIDAGSQRKTRYNVNQYTRRIQNENLVRVALLSDFQNAVLFPPRRKENIVVLSIITIAETSTGLELHFDYSASNYSFNRPWYSPVDIEHRSKIGGGIVTPTNAHGMTFNDLVSGNLTLYDQVLETGAILARDDMLKGIPGTSCYETIEPSRILVDGSGITSASRFGGIGAKYIVLANYPVKITSFCLESKKGRAIAWDHIPGTKLVVLPGTETFSSNAVIQYNEVFALAPPNQILSNSLPFTQPNITNELVISGGITISEFTNQFIDFDGSGPVPRNYTIYAKSDGSLLRTPQNIQTVFVLDDLGTLLTPISASIFGPSKIGVGLAGANPVSSMEIKIRLYGRDIDDNAIQEDIVFSGATWANVSLPGLENPNQFIKSENVFRILTDFQIVSRTNDGPNSKLQLWAELETGVCVNLNKLARVASVTWDGLAIADLRDIRQIYINIPPKQHRYLSAAEIIGLGGSSPSLLVSEDFAIPQLRDTTEGYDTPSSATFSITVNDYSRVQAGDQVSFPTGKIITAIVSGTPNRAIGQYLASTSNQETRDDIIATINDLTFNSGFTSVAGSPGNNLVTCTANTTGARGNGPVAEPVEGDPSAILISGDAIGGIDSFGECVFPKHMSSIDTAIPSPSTYNVTTYKYRYLSVPIPISDKLSIKIIIHGIPAPQTNIQLRARVATGSSEVWLPWEVLTGDGGSFILTKADVISKIQLELFGKASGFSVYSL